MNALTVFILVCFGVVFVSNYTGTTVGTIIALITINISSILFGIYLLQVDIVKAQRDVLGNKECKIVCKSKDFRWEFDDKKLRCFCRK